MQRPLNHAAWDESAVTAAVCEFVIEHVADELAAAVLDEPAHKKSGDRTAGVKRRCAGCAGKVTNAVNVVYGTYASRRGHPLVGALSYLPRDRTDDEARQAAAGIPDDVEVKTKPALARKLLADLHAAGQAPPWVSGDEVYGRDTKLRRFCETHDIGFVFEVHHSQVRLYTALQRHIILTIAALAMCSATTAARRATTATLPPDLTGPNDQPPEDPGLIALTVTEVKRLYNLLTRAVQEIIHHLHWTLWRRRHQARAPAGTTTAHDYGGVAHVLGPLSVVGSGARHACGILRLYGVAAPPAGQAGRQRQREAAGGRVRRCVRPVRRAALKTWRESSPPWRRGVSDAG